MKETFNSNRKFLTTTTTSLNNRKDHEASKWYYENSKLKYNVRKTDISKNVICRPISFCHLPPSPTRVRLFIDHNYYITLSVTCYRFGLSYYTGSRSYTVMSSTFNSLPVPDSDAEDLWLFDFTSQNEIASAISVLYVFPTNMVTALN